MKKMADFTDRLIEVCGSSQPAEIAKLLNISYQAAKNYLEGRLPDSNVLIVIAERTPYSIGWLLTGRGEKLVNKKDALILSDEIRGFIKSECVKIIGEILEGQKETSHGKTVFLKSKDVKSEKELGKSTSSSG